MVEVKCFLENHSIYLMDTMSLEYDFLSFLENVADKYSFELFHYQKQASFDQYLLILFNLMFKSNLISFTNSNAEFFVFIKPIFLQHRRTRHHSVQYLSGNIVFQQLSCNVFFVRTLITVEQLESHRKQFFCFQKLVFK